MSNTVSPFLNSLDFLTPEQRQKLASDDLDSAAAFRHYMPEYFTGERYGFSPGKAGKLITASREADHLTKRDEPDELAVALLDLANPAKHASAVRHLQALDVERVVLGEDGKVDAATTAAYQQDGAPLVPWYGPSGRVVHVAEVNGKLPHHPRTGVRLTRGDVIPWVALPRDTLVAAAAIFAASDVLAGESDRAVFEDVKKGGPMFQAIASRLREKKTRERAEAVIDGEQSQAKLDYSSPFPSPSDGPAVPATGNIARDLPALFVKMFDAAELRRFVEYGPDGDRMAGNLPGAGLSMATLAYEVTDLLRRYGQVNATLRQRLISERPRRAAEINAIFERFGVR